MIQKYQWLFTSNVGRAQKDQHEHTIITSKQPQHMPCEERILFLQEWHIIIDRNKKLKNTYKASLTSIYSLIIPLE